MILPPSLDEAETQEDSFNDYNIEVGAGLGALAGRFGELGSWVMQAIKKMF